MLNHRQLKIVQTLIRFHQFQVFYAKAQLGEKLRAISWNAKPFSTYNINESVLSAKPQEKYFKENIKSTVDEDIETDVDFIKSLATNLSESDSLVQELNACKTANAVLEVLIKRKTSTTQLLHGVTLLWHHFSQHNCPEAKENITVQIRDEIMPIISSHIHHLKSDELSYCYLYLRKMRILNSNAILAKLLISALDKIAATDTLVPLSALSRLAVGINLGGDFCVPLVCSNFVPHLWEHINKCKTPEQVRLIAICLFQLHPLVTKEILQTYKLRVLDLLKRSVLNSESPKVLLKVLRMLNLPHWCDENANLIRSVLLALKPCIDQMEFSDLNTVCRSFFHHKEPAILLEPLKNKTMNKLQEENTPDVLACAAHFLQPQEREVYIILLKQLIVDKANWQVPNASAHFFSILRDFKISDINLCNLYWSGVTEELTTKIEEQENQRFVRHCQRYMNFNNNLGGTYRHLEVEQKLVQMAMHAIEYDISGRLPSKFSRLASFVLAYGHTPFSWKKFPNMLLSRILAMTPQLSITDCFLISRGLQIALEMRFRHYIPSTLGMQVSTIDSILVSCAERHLAASEPLNASALSSIVRTLSHRKSLKNTLAYDQALARYKELDCNDLNSRAVRDLAYNFLSSNYIVPHILESMYQYVSHNFDHVSGETVEKVLTCSYNLGYTPKSIESLQYASLILLRDFKLMSALSLVQACLALCFYKIIPEELINKIFCVKFIQRIENEIHLCYARATYPERVLNLVMQLNRTVCLDFPEANVPWFQQNYIEAQMSRKTVVHTKFSDNVKKLLTHLLKDESFFRCNHITPYGYQIDFVIHFDRDRKPIPAPVETVMLDRITKVAILLLKLNSFCENDLSALRGPESLKIKHLEMMGYKVVHINEHEWNSKYCNSTDSKVNYLKFLLQITT